MENSDHNQKLLASYVYDRLSKLGGHFVGAAETIIKAENLQPQDYVVVDTPTGFLNDWEKLVCEECARLYPEHFHLVPVYLHRIRCFPLFHAEYCAKIAKKHATESLSSLSLHEDNSSKATQDAGSVSRKLDCMDREIAKRVFLKMVSDPSIVEVAMRMGTQRDNSERMQFLDSISREYGAGAGGARGTFDATASQSAQATGAAKESLSHQLMSCSLAD